MPKKWRGQLATLEITDDAGNLSADPIGVIQEVSVSPTHNIEELEGAGSTEWQDLQRTSRRVEVSGTVSAWDAEAWDTMVGYDSAAGELPDDEEVPTFTVTVEFEASDGSTKEIPVEPCYFNDPPELSGGSDEWIGMELNLVGNGLGGIVNTDASA